MPKPGRCTDIPHFHSPIIPPLCFSIFLFLFFFLCIPLFPRDMPQGELAGKPEGNWCNPRPWTSP